MAGAVALVALVLGWLGSARWMKRWCANGYVGVCVIVCRSSASALEVPALGVPSWL